LDVDGRIDNVTVEEVAGAVHLSGDFFNDMRISKVTGTVTFKSSRSDMTIASVPGDVEISGDSMRGNQINGPTRLVTRSKDIHLEDVSGDLQVETSNGEIDVHASNKLPVGRMTITGKHGDITLTLPANAGFQIEANTRKGDITSDFGAIKINENRGTSEASGTVGNGVSKLQVTADTGDIRISKG
jgi:DUF4097 and DUF4098 domain-containing protein YvlB